MVTTTPVARLEAAKRRLFYVLDALQLPYGTAADGFDPKRPQRQFDAILVDIDHSPDHLLHPEHGDFYQPAGLRRLAAHLRPGGVFALWSDDPPEPRFTAALAELFTTVDAETVRFRNPFLEQESANTVYLAVDPR
jgi:hypothetical protein